jgi:phosphatidate cytidylyltransferase
MIVILSLLFFFKDLLKFLGVFYLSSPFIILIFLRNNENFEKLLFFILYFSILTDVFSYFTGKVFKGPKIYPKISAGKTISGSIGGLLIPCIFSVLIFHNSNNIFVIIFSSIFFSLLVQLGDFLESYFKRYCNVKDSSNLIPGHGGILDRLDGLILLILIIFILNQLNFNFFFII